MPDEAPDGAAVFPLIPPEFGVHPLLLAVLHALLSLSGLLARALGHWRQ